jgi:hypothetical protein
VAFDPAAYASGKGLSLSNDALGVAREFFDFQVAQGGSKAVSDNYTRELVNFLAWIEGNGHALNSVPSSAVDGYLNTTAAHLAPGTRDMKRNYLRATMKKLKELGLDWSHLHFDNEIPEAEREARRKERAKEQKAAVTGVPEKLHALQQQFARVPPGVGAGSGAVATGPQGSSAQAPASDPSADYPPPFNPQPSPESPVSTAPAVDPNAPVQPAAPAAPAPVIYMPVPQPRVAAAPRPVAAAPQTLRANLNGVLFNGPFVTIRQTADGSVPGTMGGQQLYIARVALSEIIRQGAPEVYIAKHVLNHPSVKLSTDSATATFTLHDTTAQQIEPGNFIEVSVPVPMMPARGGVGASGFTGNLGLPQTPVDPSGAYSYPGGAAGQPPAPQPTLPAAESIWMKKIEQDIAAKEEAAKGLQAQLDKERVETRRMELQQQIDRENTLRTELLELRKILNDRVNAPAATGPDLAGFARTMAEALRPAPPPPDTTKDMLLTMMKLQGEQANQQLLQMREQARIDREAFDRRQEAEAKRVDEQRREDNRRAEERARDDMKRAEDNQKFLIGILTQKKEESDFEKMAKTMMMKKLTDDEGGFDKTLKQISQMREVGLLPDGSGGGDSLIKDLINVAPSLLKGAADMTRANGFMQQFNGPPKQVAGQPPAAQQQAGQPVVQRTPAQTPAAQIPAGDQPVLSQGFRAAAVELYEASAAEADEPGERAGLALQMYIQALMAEEGLPMASKQALLKAINEADAYEDLYQVAKAALVFGGIGKPTPEQIGPIAVVLHRKYGALYGLLNNGESKVLVDDGLFEGGDEDGEGEEAVEGEEQETAGAVAAEAPAPAPAPAPAVTPAPKVKMQIARAAAAPEAP